LKKASIKVGSHYTAKVSGKIVTVRVDAIRDFTATSFKPWTRYDCVNLATGRKLVFRSAAKFRAEMGKPISSINWPS
jgi:hypothetical protein